MQGWFSLTWPERTRSRRSLDSRAVKGASEKQIFVLGGDGCRRRRVMRARICARLRIQSFRGRAGRPGGSSNRALATCSGARASCPCRVQSGACDRWMLTTSSCNGNTAPGVNGDGSRSLDKERRRDRVCCCAKEVSANAEGVRDLSRLKDGNVRVRPNTMNSSGQFPNMELRRSFFCCQLKQLSA